MLIYLQPFYTFQLGFHFYENTVTNYLKAFCTLPLEGTNIFCNAEVMQIMC